jgi:serine/threonine protein kinase
MEPSVESFCNSLSRSRLMPKEQIRAMHQRCQKEAPDACTDLQRFLRWVVRHDYLTEYQVGCVQRDNAHELLLGPYKVLERIGRGRMAGVYKALHELGQVVAIKVLPPSRARDPQKLARFQRESRLALRLKHPNIVRAFEMGAWHGLHGFVMEYLEGETLEEALARRGRLAPGEAVRLICQALDGLQHIHDEGLVHRDLKPGNLMLVGGAPATTLPATVKILDIGLGRALFDEDPSGEGINWELTNKGDVLGTPVYMAPEQARDAHSADVRADIYSLGCTLYHALAGQPPFTDTNLARLLIRHATEQPRPVRALNPQVPEGLEQVLSKTLAKDPSQRYATPEKTAAALRPFLSAGAEVEDIERQPRMAAYVRWLEAQWGRGDSAPAPPVRRPPLAPPPPLPPVSPATVADTKPVPPTPEPRVVRPGRKGKRRHIETVDVVPVHEPLVPSKLRLNRDLVMLCVGIAVFSLIVIVVVTIILLTRK